MLAAQTRATHRECPRAVSPPPSSRASRPVTPLAEHRLRIHHGERHAGPAPADLPIADARRPTRPRRSLHRHDRRRTSPALMTRSLRSGLGSRRRRRSPSAATEVPGLRRGDGRPPEPCRTARPPGTTSTCSTRSASTCWCVRPAQGREPGPVIGTYRVLTPGQRTARRRPVQRHRIRPDPPAPVALAHGRTRPLVRAPGLALGRRDHRAVGRAGRVHACATSSTR